MKRIFCLPQSGYFFSLLLLMTAACNDATLIGSDILPPEDNVNVYHTDTLTIESTTFVDEPIKIFDDSLSVQPTAYLVGNINNSTFGSATASFYTQLGLLLTGIELDSTTLDSVFLNFRYSNSGHYGDLDAPFDIEVYEITEDITTTGAYYSDKTFAVGDKIGELKGFNPNVSDSILLDSVKLPPILRIPLTAAIGQRFIDAANESAYESDEDFLDFFKGVHVRGTANNQAILAFNILSGFSGITVYYTQYDTLKRTLDFIAKSQYSKSINFEHNYANASVSPFLNSKNLGDSLVFVQAMQGLNIKIDFPYADNFKNVIINKAELTITVTDTTDLTKFPLLEQLILTEKNENGEFVTIEDAIIALAINYELEGLFGGNLEKVNNVYQYKINMTGHFQRIVDDQTPENAVYLSAYPKSSQAAWAVLGGAKNAAAPIKFTLLYTKL